MNLLSPRRIGVWLLATLAAWLLLPSALMAQQVLRYSDHEPLGGMRTTFLQEVFFPAIEKASNGRLKVESHWGGQRAGAYDALRATSQGQVVDMATVVPEYTAKELELHQIFKSFPVGPAGQQQVAFFRRVYAQVPEFSAELAANNVVPVFLATGYPLAFFSTAPMKSLDDMQGRRWRTASFWHRDFLNQSGAVPVSMPWGPQVYDALNNKTLDGLMVNVDSGQELKVHQVAPNVLLSRDLWLGHLYLVAMNRDTWNALPPEDQQAIQQAAETAYRSLGEVMGKALQRMVDTLAKEGASVRTLTQDEVTAWQAAVRYPAVQAAWVQSRQGQTATTAGPVLEKVRQLMPAFLRQLP
jgi:TRAP-type C4-dicarboxylate transport system substrate-binding protein